MPDSPGGGIKSEALGGAGEGGDVDEGGGWAPLDLFGALERIDRGRGTRGRPILSRNGSVRALYRGALPESAWMAWGAPGKSLQPRRQPALLNRLRPQARIDDSPKKEQAGNTPPVLSKGLDSGCDRSKLVAVDKHPAIAV